MLHVIYSERTPGRQTRWLVSLNEANPHPDTHQKIISAAAIQRIILYGKIRHVNNP